MPYALIRKAIVARESLTGLYDDYVRMFSPHIIGKDRDGQPAVLVFQYGGRERGGLPAGGEWQCFRVANLHAVRPNGDRWLVGPLYGKSIDCISEIDLSV
jgi:hypothetical protein